MLTAKVMSFFVKTVTENSRITAIKGKITFQLLWKEKDDRV